MAVNDNTLLFWAIAVLLVLMIYSWNRARLLAVPGVCRNYIVGGTLVGMMAGVVLGNAGLICGAAIGAVLGGVAYGRNAQGRGMTNGAMWRSVMEVGLPAVVTMSLLGLVVDGLIH